ncbi:MAG: polysaccharide biosynthesis/export family protein [bacterium]
MARLARLQLMVAVACAALVVVGCSTVQKKTGGAPAKPAAKPVPKLSASATSINISTSVQAAAPSRKDPVPPAAPALAASAVKSTPPALRESTATAYKLRGGDPVIIFLRGILPKDDELQDIIDEAGYLNLPYIGAILAAGKTTSQLESEIHNTYLEKLIYKSVTVNVVLPSQSFFVRGEARIPGRFPLITGMTVLQAISAAGGYTDYANPKDVNIIRGGKGFRVNARDFERHPEKDVAIEPGDVIVIPRSFF